MNIYEFKEQDAYDFARHINARVSSRGDELIFQSCPYCHGRGKSNEKTFSINMKSGMFHCHRSSCGISGNMITLAKDFDFSLGNMVDEYYRPTKIYKSYPKAKKPMPTEPVLAYLQERGISKATAEKYHVTGHKDKAGTMVIPFYDENDNLCMIKYRNINWKSKDDGSKEWFDKGGKPILFGMDVCNKDNITLVMTEGQMDALALAEAGIENAVSVPNGAKGFTWIPYCWDWMKRFSRLIIFGDYEKGKISLLDEMSTRFHGAVYHVREENYKGLKDANDILKHHGKAALVEAVENAALVENTRLKYVANIKRMNISELEKMTCQIKSLNKTLGGFYFGQLVVLTGRRGEGKSTFSGQLMLDAVNQGYNVLSYSGELPDWQFRMWIDRQAAGSRHIKVYDNSFGGKEYEVYNSTKDELEMWYADKFITYDCRIVEDGENLLKTLETAIKQYACKVLFVDNLMSAMEMTDVIESDFYRAQTKFVVKLVQLAKMHNVLIFLIAHQRKTINARTDNDDVSGSANITNLADIVISYGKPAQKSANDVIPDDERVIAVLKNRMTGTLGKDITVYYDSASKRINDCRDFDWRYGWDKQTQSIPEMIQGFTESEDAPF